MFRKNKRKERKRVGRGQEQREGGGEKIPRMRSGKPQGESERKVNAAAGTGIKRRKHRNGTKRIKLISCNFGGMCCRGSSPGCNQQRNFNMELCECCREESSEFLTGRLTVDTVSHRVKLGSRMTRSGLLRTNSCSHDSSNIVISSR